MPLSSFSPSSVSRVSNPSDLVARYQRFRPVLIRLNHVLVGRLPRDVLREGARKLGILRGDIFVFDSEDETCVLMDYCIYDVYRKGCNAVDQYLCDCPPDAGSDEMVVLRAMQHATYAIVAVLGTEPGLGCYIRNLFTGETRLLVDLNLSRTASRGATMATRLLDFGDYVTTTGALVPIAKFNDAELDFWERRFRETDPDDGFEPATLLRKALRRGAHSCIQYAESGANRRSKPAMAIPRVDDAAKRDRAIAARRSISPEGKQRCRCGSGKMYKNCCMKR